MWLSRQEWRRHCRELAKAEARANASEKWAKGLVNSILTSRGQQGVPIVAPTTEKHYTPSPVLPDTVQGWTKDEFVAQLTADGTYKSQAEALEAWKSAQATGKFPYQDDGEFVS